ncbi:MAG TPA: polysaccharide pyruvyl transferase family protein, partial [Fimbriimonadaceae bacterium]|nr:polysaccharide pyruvyl transferase family protein [Fimbriimonadaceae bacterium]
MPHLLVAGHFGAGNLGDDAILLGFASGLNSGEFDMTVMSGSPEETFRNFGFRSIPRKDMAAFEKALPSCDALVFAGGSIFQDVTSVKSVGFYSQLVAKAKKAGKKVIMLGQGVGPLNTFFGKRWATAAYNCSEAIVVRDAASISTLKSLGVKAPIRLGADMAFLLPEPQGNEDAQGFNVGDMKTVGIAPRPWGKDKKFVVSLFAEVAKLLFQAKMMPVLIEMDREHDHQLILEI